MTSSEYSLNSPPGNIPDNISDTDEYKILSDDLKRLDEQEQKDGRVMTVYSKNQFIFLLQSFVLGMSYSIIWPTVWKYAEVFNLPPEYTKLLYGLTYIAYPVASMISAQMVESICLSTKATILLLNCLEIIGNLVYTLDYYPILPCLGRFMAGLGDAFYVVLMREMKTKHGNAMNEKITLECLAAFIIGVVVAPGFNILATLLHFRIGHWILNSNSYPGLIMAILFSLTQFAVIFLLPVMSGTESSEKFTDSEGSISDSYMQISDYSTIFISVYSFLYTYIVTSLELMIPITIYELFNISVIGAILLYAVVATMYALILMVTMTVSFSHPMETYFGVTILMQVVGIFSVLYLSVFRDKDSVATIVCITLIVFSLATMWSNDDVLFISLVQTLVPYHKRENTHKTRKLLSKLAFCIGGVTVPFCYWYGFIIIGPLLIFLICINFFVLVVLRYKFAPKNK